MAAIASQRFAFSSQDEERRYWVGRLKAESPRPSRATVWSIYRCKPVQELLWCLASSDSALSTIAAETLWNIWWQDLGPERESRLNVAYMLYEDGLTTEALKVCDAVAADGPQSAEALSLRGRIRMARGDYPGGREDCKAALSINPNHWPTLRAWAAAAGQAGNRFDLIRALEGLASLFPSDQAVREQLRRARSRTIPSAAEAAGRRTEQVSSD